jgi:hypothetical protein
MSQKSSDFSAVPLCSGHHREDPDSYHRLGEQEFSRKHGIDLQEIVLRLQRRFWRQSVPTSRLVHPVQVLNDRVCDIEVEVRPDGPPNSPQSGR